jgi:hypothetical protein
MAATLVIIGGASRASGQTPAADSVTAILRVAPISVSGYQRYGFPRRDLTVRVGDVTVAPGLALGGWVGFVGSADHTMVAGDLVVTAAELPAVVRSLTGDRIAITAIHNHLAGETPNVLYVHIHQMGPPVAIATAIDRALRQTGTPRGAAPAPPPLGIDTTLVFRRLGISGRAQGIVASVSPVVIPGEVRVGDAPALLALVAASPLNIQRISDDRAVATGDFALLARQVDPVFRALVEHGITPTSLHSHLIGESPTITYLHFWGDGRLDDLLSGLRAALDATR